MTSDDFNISRRKTLAALGTIGVASAGAGLGTSAYFSDQETFENNTLVAGTLDMGVGYSAHYSDWSEDEGDGVGTVRMPEGEVGGPNDLGPGEVGLPTNEEWLIAVEDEAAADQFLANTQYESYNDGSLDCVGGAANSQADDAPKPVIDLEDVKPGDFGEVTFDFVLCDNPGYVWLNGSVESCSENGITEPEADDPDESSLLPLLAAGAVPSASSLTDSELRERVAETVSDGDDGLLTRKNLMRATTAGVVGTAGLGAATGNADAAPGDSLGEVTFPNTGVGVGITFTGEYLLVPDGYASFTVDIYELPAGGNGAATYVATKTLPNQISGIEWDPTREQLWATYNGDPFYLVDLGDLTTSTTVDAADMTPQFSVPNQDVGWPADGTAYDGSTDTIWFSSDSSTETIQLNPDGSLANRITPELNANGDQFDNNSGVAVGADLNGRPTLYLGNNPGPANGSIIRVYADDGEYIADFATGTQFRVEDIVCDPITYDVESILVRDSNNNRYQAFEVEAGTCPVAGQPDIGECANVELLDVVRAAAWVDDGDNYQDGDETPAVVGSLRSVLGQLEDGNGLELPGDIDAEAGGGTGQQGCFSAETTHSVAFAWWVPVDHGNEIQSDSVTFDLSFYTEQCRHNDGSGLNNEAVDGDQTDDN